jgi:hypothetical protein
MKTMVTKKRLRCFNSTIWLQGRPLPFLCIYMQCKQRTGAANLGSNEWEQTDKNSEGGDENEGKKVSQ